MTAPSNKIRVRFAPSPTGYLHIGGARTVLFNWLIARKHGGALLLRIEDTDQARNVEDSVAKIVEDLRWLGLTWDEGPEVGGEFGPYYQSQRLALYEEHIQFLLNSGDAYYALESPEQLAAMRESAKREKRPVTYLRPNPIPTVDDGRNARNSGKPVVVRLKMPPLDITITDDILGSVTLPANQAEDFVIQKSDGFPTYHFACVVDDERMKITHVLRGQEHLMNTPKHIALQKALGFATPRYAHLPVIFNTDGSKMSKRDKEKAIAAGRHPPEIDVHDFRASGYFPEAVLNFIALLGWSPGEEREFFTLEELVDRFTIERVGKTNAKFDREKLLSFNTSWAAKLPASRLLEAFRDYLTVNSGVVLGASTALAAPDDFLSRVLASCAGFRTLADVMKKTGFLFIHDDALVYDEKAVQKVLLKNDGEGKRVLGEWITLLESHSDWTGSTLERVVADFATSRNISLGQVAQPIRVALTGNTISPTIHDTLELLGRDRSIARIHRCIQGRF